VPDVIRRNLALFTLLAALVGGLGSSIFRWRLSHSARSLTVEELLREIEMGNSMPMIAVSQAITNKFAGPSPSLESPISLETKDQAEVFIPDKYAAAALVCETTEPVFRQVLDSYGKTWFRGTVSGPVRSIKTDSGDLLGDVTVEGSIYRCHGNETVIVGSGVKVTLPLREVGDGAIRVLVSNGWVAYPAAMADLFVSFLLMVFIPTLTLSIMKAVLDSAESDHGAAALFRHSFGYFTATTLLAGLIGTAAGYISYIAQPAGTNLRDIASVSVGNSGAVTEYEPHPILNELIGIVPTNPLAALSNPDGNKGLQVAFLAVIVGILLSVIGEERRRRASQWLKNSLALIVKDADLKWRALSDWADLLTPIGVFFISIKFGATVSYEFLWEMLTVILAIFAALALHCALLLAWTIARRNWRDWFRRGLVPGIPGLLTALATSSSYAALPGIAAVPLLADNSARRGVFDFCTTINKNGTTIYIATVASYVLFYQMHGAVNSLVLVVLVLSGLASVATAGLPFAAVFGLRMVLLASNSPGGLAWAILPIDPLVDRFVTVLNVFANLAACSEAKTDVAEKVWTRVPSQPPPSAESASA
jgi:Na+/H+-dicarboxylate symporter